MATKMRVYVGTYTEPIRFGTGQILEGKGEGIYLLEMDMEKGNLKLLHTTKTVNPSYLTLNSTHTCLYAVNELKEFEGRASGSISAFRVDRDTGRLQFLNRRATQGTDPCHVAVDDTNSHVFVTNFMSGSVCVFPIEADGALGGAQQSIQHEGSSIDPRRQAGPHAHSLVLDLPNEYAFVPDLGKDMVMIYRYDKNGTPPLAPGEFPYVRSVAGAGPRHCVFHPSGRFCYVVNELNSTVTALRYDQSKGKLEPIQDVSTLPGNQSVANSCADIQMTPDGKLLYASNRGHDSIAIFRIDDQSGKLQFVDCEASGGKTPRNFAIDPTGKYVLVGNQDTDNIVVFRIEAASGVLRRVAERSIPTPVCIKPYLWS